MVDECSPRTESERCLVHQHACHRPSCTRTRARRRTPTAVGRCGIVRGGRVLSSLKLDVYGATAAARRAACRIIRRAGCRRRRCGVCAGRLASAAKRLAGDHRAGVHDPRDPLRERGDGARRAPHSGPAAARPRPGRLPGSCPAAPSPASSAGERGRAAPIHSKGTGTGATDGRVRDPVLPRDDRLHRHGWVGPFDRTRPRIGRIGPVASHGAVARERHEPGRPHPRPVRNARRRPRAERAVKTAR